MRVGSGEGEGGRRGKEGSGDIVSSMMRWKVTRSWRGEGTIPMTTSHMTNSNPRLQSRLISQRKKS